MHERYLPRLVDAPLGVNQINKSQKVPGDKMVISHDRVAYVSIPKMVVRGMHFVAVEHNGNEVPVMWRGNTGDNVNDAVARSLCSHWLERGISAITDAEFAGMHQECDCEQPLIYAKDKSVDVAIILPTKPGYGTHTVKQCNCHRCGQSVLVKAHGLPRHKVS